MLFATTILSVIIICYQLILNRFVATIQQTDFFHMNRTGSGHRWSKVGCLSQARDLGTSLIVIVNNDLQAAAWCSWCHGLSENGGL
jgi:hypothetical protein